jgi:hypothetical protein
MSPRMTRTQYVWQEVHRPAQFEFDACDRSRTRLLAGEDQGHMPAQIGLANTSRPGRDVGVLECADLPPPSMPRDHDGYDAFSIGSGLAASIDLSININVLCTIATSGRR